MDTTMTEALDIESLIKRNVGQRILIWVIIIIGSIALSFRNYLLFHTGVELFSIVIAFMIFAIAVNVPRHNLVFLGVSYGFIACFDLLHTPAYKGMGVFLVDNADLPTQLWIISIYMESITLLLSGYFYNKEVKVRDILHIYAAISIILLMLIFRWDMFPACFVEGQGLTLFKKLSEIIICGIIALATLRLVKIRHQFNQRVFWNLIISFVLTMLSEVAFIFYIDVYDLSNMVGHIFKLLSFYLIYKSIVEVALLMPYKELYKRERDHNQFTQLLPQSIFVLVEDRIVFANTSANKLLGKSSLKDIQDKSIFSFVKPLSRYETNESSISDIPPRLCIGEQRIKIIDGKELQVDILKAPYTFNDNEAEIVVIHDLTERIKVKTLSLELAREEKRLEEVIEFNRIKTDFFSNVSHEFKTPLNVILGTVQLMELYSSRRATDEIMTMEQTKMLKTMKQNCNRLLRLINNMIDLTKIDSGYLTIKLVNENIVSVVEDVVLSVSDYIKGKGIKLIFDTEVEEKVIACDSDSIERIILNLLSNAIKFTDPGGSIFVDILDSTKYVTVSVRDTGVGIPKEKLSKVFERFMQVDQTLSRNREGTGIGLYLVKSLVEMHGGIINVFSQEGVGTEFVIKLPVQLVKDSVDKEHHDITNQDKTEKISIEFSDIYSIM